MQGNLNFSYYRQPLGYGRLVIGGDLGEITKVSSKSQLESHLLSESPEVILIDSDIVFDSGLALENVRNKTILGIRPGITLSSPSLNKKESGILLFKNSENLIISNLTFKGPGAYDCNGEDLLCFDGVRNAWVDHCEFYDGLDENFSIKHDSNFITISFCKFDYLLPPIPGGTGGSNDHRNSNLIGCNKDDKPGEGNYFITLLGCYWGNGCVSRMTRSRNAHLHYVNCLWDPVDAIYYMGPENTDSLVEGCMFRNVKASDQIVTRMFSRREDSKIGVKFSDTVAYGYTNRNKEIALPEIQEREVFIPDYSLTVIPLSELENYIKEQCGNVLDLSH